MNIFLVGWNIDKGRHEQLRTALSRMPSIFHSLDERTLWQGDCGKIVFAGCIHHPSQAISPRRYIHEGEGQAVFYDGVVVDPDGTVNAWDAGELHANWNQLHEIVEGQFAAVRIQRHPCRMEVMVDPVGIAQVYYARLGDSWYVSNNLQLLSMATGLFEPDPMGVSLFLGTGGLGMDLTLRKGVRVIPGGQVWKWEEGEKKPRVTFYFHPSDVIFHRKKTFSEQELASLADQLARPMKRLQEAFGPLEAPITAGKDSRLMTALLVQHGVEAEYFSAGAPEQVDVRIGAKIAKTLGLPHEVRAHDTARLGSQWRQLTSLFCAQNDGSVTLAHVANALYQPEAIEKLGVHLYGICGEFARKTVDDRDFYLRRPSLEFYQQYLYRFIAEKKNRLLVKPEVYEHVRRYCNQVVERFWNYDFPRWDVMAARRTFERAPRWAGANFRQVVMNTDVFSPFCTRPFLRAALQLHSLRRHVDHLHWLLIRHLNPVLWGIELEKPWKPQHPVVTMGNFILQPLRDKVALRSRLRRLRGIKPGTKPVVDPGSRQFQRARWLEANLKQVRSVCLDNGRSDLWRLVDRRQFERLTSASSSENERRKRHKEIYDALTLFTFERCQEAFA